MSLTSEENNILDIKVLQKDRRRSSAGYPFKTFDEMCTETVAKNWLIKGVLARGRRQHGLRLQAARSLRCWRKRRSALQVGSTGRASGTGAP